MSCTFFLRPLKRIDHIEIKEVFCDAIVSQADPFYSKDQIEAWSSLAYLPGIFDLSLNNGNGWVVVVEEIIEAFAVRYPSTNIDLLYCRGRSTRNGYATALLKRIELDSSQEGLEILSTRASLLSRSLFLRCGWSEHSISQTLIAGISFDCYHMYKNLKNI